MARYRWWIGHQTTFCVWRLLTDCLTELAGQPASPAELVNAAASMYDIYSLLLLYTGNCSPEVYETAIRPEMAAADAAFTGRWARDFEQIPGLQRKVKQKHSPRALTPLVDASKANRVVHMAVARRLTGGTESLLRLSGQPVDGEVTDHHRDLYDAFFHVRRTELCRHHFGTQLLVLCTAVLHDLTSSPLDLDVDWAMPRTSENEAIARCGNEGTAGLRLLITSSYAGRVLP